MLSMIEDGMLMSYAEKIRLHAREKYVIPARDRKQMRFSIRAGDVLREMGMSTRNMPGVCEALKGSKFWQANNLRLLEVSGPPSKQSPTVVCTYEFADPKDTNPALEQERPWIRLRGALKDIFANLGGGEAYLRAERESFYPTNPYPPKEDQ
jgi:hypothetical protein